MYHYASSVLQNKQLLIISHHQSSPFRIIYPQLSSFIIIRHHDLLSLLVLFVSSFISQNRGCHLGPQRPHLLSKSKTWRRWGDRGSPARKASANLLGRCWACWIALFVDICLHQMKISIIHNPTNSTTFLSFWQRLARGRRHFFFLTEFWELVQIDSIL